MRHWRRRGKVNPARVATSKRYLFWMIAAIAAASSVLRERAAFATPFGSFARTLLQHSRHHFGSFVFILHGARQSFHVKNVKDGNFRSHDLLGVFLSVCVGDLF